MSFVKDRKVRFSRTGLVNLNLSELCLSFWMLQQIEYGLEFKIVYHSFDSNDAKEIVTV